jgi:histidine ammonia-lyase
MEAKLFEISLKPITVFDCEKLMNNNHKLKLSAEALEKVIHCRSFLEAKIADKNSTFYGINTGFGSLCNTKISSEDLTKLQENLVLSHACGMGPEIPLHISKLIFFLKIKNLSKGYSGVTTTLLDMMVTLYNVGVVPKIYEHGSLGASGDLAPLAHLATIFLGNGKAYFEGKELSSKQILAKAKLNPIDLKAKEGLALLNGTQFSLAFAVYEISQAMRLLDVANKIAALSLDAYACDNSPFNHLIHDIRPHKGQLAVAKQILENRSGSDIEKIEKYSVQDPYSFRCIPQVHGASSDAFDYIINVVETELNGVTDNPNIFPDDDAILSGGNFHAQPLALVLDHLAIALAELGNISERRTYQLINGDRDLPAYLAANPGINSGYMIPQYPASIDSIVSSKGQEDHVSMAANAATKCYKVLYNVKSILGIEWLVANQAMDFRKGIKSSEMLESYRGDFRKSVPFRDVDVYMKEDMDKSRDFIQNMIDE